MATNPVRPRSNAVTSSSDPINQPVLQSRARKGAVSGRPIPDLAKLMQDGFFYLAFLNFARSEFSGECLEFWAEVQDFKKMSFPTVMAARAIYSKYVAENSPKEINIRNETRNEVKRALVQMQGVYESGYGDRYNLHQVLDQAMVENVQTFSDTYSRFIFSDAYASRMRQMGYSV